jgi:hypothetical protein
MKPPYTHEELADLKSKLTAHLTDVEQEFPDARPLPAMTEEEAGELLITLVQTSTTRTLTREEVFLMGQLLTTYRMAIEARMLGRKGRYFVVGEKDIERMRRNG